MVPIAVASPQARIDSGVTSRGTGYSLALRSPGGDRPGARRRHSLAFRRSFAPRPSSAPLLRAALTRYLTANRIHGGTVPTIVLCADEALINAVQHAPGGDVRVAAEVRGDRLVLEVADGGPGFDPGPPDDDPLPDLMGEHGRGLFLIRHLTDDFEILSGNRGTTLRMELSLSAD